MTTPRLRHVAFALGLFLLAGAALRADDRYQRPYGGFGRIEGRPDRDELLMGARPYATTARAADGVGARPYERRAITPTAAPPPRRTMTDYYPAMRGVRAHCTPSRGQLMGVR